MGKETVMDEKRKDRRLDLEVALEMERLDQSSMPTMKLVHVNVTDLSSSGIGFDTEYLLEHGAMYNTRIKIWTNGVIETVIRIVHCESIADNKYHCGASFVGLSNADETKINIYGMLHPQE